MLMQKFSIPKSRTLYYVSFVSPDLTDAQKWVDARESVYIRPLYFGDRATLHKQGEKVAMFYDGEMEDIISKFEGLSDSLKSIPNDFVLEGTITEEGKFITTDLLYLDQDLSNTMFKSRYNSLSNLFYGSIQHPLIALTETTKLEGGDIGPSVMKIMASKNARGAKLIYGESVYNSAAQTSSTINLIKVIIFSALVGEIQGAIGEKKYEIMLVDRLGNKVSFGTSLQSPYDFIQGQKISVQAERVDIKGDKPKGLKMQVLEKDNSNEPDTISDVVMMAEISKILTYKPISKELYGDGHVHYFEGLLSGVAIENYPERHVHRMPEDLFLGPAMGEEETHYHVTVDAEGNVLGLCGLPIPFVSKEQLYQPSEELRQSIKTFMEMAGESVNIVSKARASQMVNGNGLTLEAVKQMKSFYDNYDEETQKAEWLLYGAEVGRQWCNDLIKEVEGLNLIEPEAIDIPQDLALALAALNGGFEVEVEVEPISNGCGDKPDDLMIPIKKIDEEKMQVFGVVLEPDYFDAHNDTMTPEEVEKAAHYHMTKSRLIGFRHSETAEAELIESYIARTDFDLNGQVVKKGSWVIGVQVKEKSLWDMIKSGEINSFSVGGFGLRNPIE